MDFSQTLIHKIDAIVDQWVEAVYQDEQIEGTKELTFKKELALIVDCNRAPERVVTDPLRLQQIITNLLSNAIRYTKSGTVRLDCEKVSEEQWAISVIDSGIGIPLDAQTQIFNPYFRTVSDQDLQGSDGTGLGLAILSRLVELMHGEIKVVLQPGEGSTFTVMLPLEAIAREDSSTI
ncbi:hypothetical protein H6G27_30995 [Nostoc linckia FACHB-104]|nr:hypothetical protein [Nostoc linckia FACHB-104]